MSTRLYVDAPLAIGTTLTLPESAFRHWVQVLRARVGDPVRLFDGRGNEVEAQLCDIGKREARVTVLRLAATDRESCLRLVLAQAVSKGDRMDYTVQKAVELGVSEIIPLVSERSVVKLDAERWDRKFEHWQGVIVSACEQCGRNVLPRLHPVHKLGAWLDATSFDGLRLTLAPKSARSLRGLPAPDAACLLVGPEGGLSELEIAAASSAGFIGLRLGPRTLRTETAGVAALAAMQALWGDLG